MLYIVLTIWYLRVKQGQYNIHLRLRISFVGSISFTSWWVIYIKMGNTRRVQEKG